VGWASRGRVWGGGGLGAGCDWAVAGPWLIFTDLTDGLDHLKKKI
jgi:hypothetical protein